MKVTYRLDAGFAEVLGVLSAVEGFKSERSVGRNVGAEVGKERLSFSFSQCSLITVTKTVHLKVSLVRVLFN